MVKNVNNVYSNIREIKREALEEKKKDLAGNQRIIETKPGEHHTLTRMTEA